MDKTLEKVITNNKQGLFLLDPPTGFGKTTSVINVIKRFLDGDSCFSGVQRMIFVTNLLTNLPYDTMLGSLTEDEKKQCFRAKATVDYILERFLNANITDLEVKNSKEYENLYKDVESYQFQKDSLNNEKDPERKSGYRNSMKILKQKISADSEPAFRKYIKNRFIFNKSISERNSFINDNSWFTYLYPVCNIEKFKVIFLSTKKFISPMDTFRRVPFYAYCDDELMKDAVVFIDEFDSTKQEFLNQIIEDGFKSKTDIVSLFLSMHYALQNLTLPKKILYTSNYHKAKVESGEWHTTEEHFSYWRNKFNEKYEKHNIKYLLKSIGFEANKAFLFDDGRYFSVVKDSSKKFICANVDEREDILSLRGMSRFSEDSPLINFIIRDLEYCIDGFAQALFYVANNFLYYKNQDKPSNETKYTLEESLYTVLDVLNLGDEEKDYLFTKIQTEDYSFNKQSTEEGMRKGFNFTEIEDSNYHDMKSVVHNYSFPTTPEDALLKLAARALTIGISATAKIKTCIGNYDLSYLKDKLGDYFIEIELEDKKRISKDFNALMNSTKGKYTINTKIIDNYDAFSKKELCEILINQLFEGELANKYINMLNALNKNHLYYFVIELKLAFFYKELGDKDIKSAIAFVNKFPNSQDKFDLDRLNALFADIDNRFNRQAIICKIINTQNFDEEFEDAKKMLSEGKQVLLITTYQTVGSGKNIQYPIPVGQEDTMVFESNDDRRMKDFEAIYVCTPTHLLQYLSFDSEDKYGDLAKYLFQQEYLYKNDYLSYSQMKINIENGFRKVFYGEKKTSRYTCNGDLYLHTLKVIIQAIGRICRCRSKNKNIYIYSDRELLRNIKAACEKDCPELLNEEFKKLLSTEMNDIAFETKIKEYSMQSKRAYYSIIKAAYTVRNSRQNVAEWKAIREYVLKNPTTPNMYNEYQSLYFEMPNEIAGYSYKYNNKFDIIEMYLEPRFGFNQVSAQSCDLPIILSIPCVKEMFKEKRYAMTFERNKYIMSPSLYKQVYVGALGEVVGKCILEFELGCDLEEFDDYSLYEYFDYKIGNVYFDFKHWDNFIIDNDKYVRKVENKLKKIKGAKCFVINIVKRNDAQIKQNIGETVVQVPYLIDGETGTVNDSFIEQILMLLE